MSMIWTSTGDHADMETMSKNKIHAPAYCKGQGSYFYHGIYAHRYTAEKTDMEDFCPHPPKKKAIKETS